MEFVFALGQVDAKAQMILISETDHQNQGNGSPIDSSQAQDNDHASDNNGDPNTNGHLDCSDILRRPRLVENDKDGQVSNVSRNVALTAMQQAVVLAQCLHLKRRSREDELSSQCLFIGYVCNSFAVIFVDILYNMSTSSFSQSYERLIYFPFTLTYSVILDFISSPDSFMLQGGKWPHI